jgi:hypothetical protein
LPLSLHCLQFDLNPSFSYARWSAGLTAATQDNPQELLFSASIKKTLGVETARSDNERL